MQHSKKSVKLNPNKALATLCERRFYRFFLEMWETIEAVELMPNWHIEEICNELQRSYEIWERKESQDDILLNVPPGSSKSTIVTQLFPAWLWVKNPSIRIISSSYNADLSVSHAVKTRDCLKSEKFNRLWPDHINFKRDSDGKTDYKNTKKGQRFATSTGGTVTGMHGDFILNDDPINPKKAASEVELKNAVEFNDKTLSTRKTDKKRSVTIMIMQRLDERDPAGDWLRKQRLGMKTINHMCLPGRLSDSVRPSSLRDKYTNGLLDTNRLDEQALAKLMEDLGSYGFAGQIQQEPAPADGGIWKKWFIPIPDHLMPSPRQMDKYGTDWDTAYTKNESNAASAYITSGMYENKMHIDGLGWMYEEIPELLKSMRLLPDPHYVEAKASGKSIKQLLTTEKIPCIEVDVAGDKIVRAKSAAPKAEAGMVCIRASLLDKLYNDHEQGILKFPNGFKKDLADALAQAIWRHFGKPEREIHFGWN